MENNSLKERLRKEDWESRIKRYKVIAKEDYNLDGHTWTKGLDYEAIEKENSITIASNEAQLSWTKRMQNDILELFEAVE